MATRYPGGINVGSLSVDGVEVTATAAQLNQTVGIAGAALATTSAGKKATAGGQSVTGSATIVTGLATVTRAVATLRTVGVGAGDPFVVTVVPSGTAGSIDVAVKQDDGDAASVAAGVDWVAYGT